MKHPGQLVDSSSTVPEQAAGTTGLVRPMMGAGWSELMKRQSEWMMKSYAAVFSPATDERLLESNAAGHAVARSQAAFARLREAREPSEIMAIWGEINTSAAAFAAGYWQQMMGVAGPSQGGKPAFFETTGRPDQPTAFPGSWPDVQASMFKLFTAPMNMALHASERHGSGSH